jgi:mannose/fructose/N-acetylgalactosamine-specific phosphotransferase system component IIC
MRELNLTIIVVAAVIGFFAVGFALSALVGNFILGFGALALLIAGGNFYANRRADSDHAPR